MARCDRRDGCDGACGWVAASPGSGHDVGAVGDAGERDKGGSARDSCGRRRSSVGERDERDGSADGGQRVHVAELRDASGGGEAGFSGDSGLGRQYGGRDVIRTGGSVAALQDD